MQQHKIGVITETAMSFIPSEKYGKDSRVGIYHGRAKVGEKLGKKVFEFVKAGPHIDAKQAKNIYIQTIVKRSGQTIYVKYFELAEVIVYNRMNYAKYSRLLNRFSKVKLSDTAQLGLDVTRAALNDRDIEYVIELSRGELISRFGKFQY